MDQWPRLAGCLDLPLANAAVADPAVRALASAIIALTQQKGSAVAPEPGPNLRSAGRRPCRVAQSHAFRA